MADKATRDKAMPKMMEDPRTRPDEKPMPFDGSFSIYGGFRLSSRSAEQAAGRRYEIAEAPPCGASDRAGSDRRSALIMVVS